MTDVFRQVDSLSQLQEVISSAHALALYFEGADCGVCSALKPKLGDLFPRSFPNIETWTVNSNKQPEIAAAYGVFSIPTLLIFFESKEWFRKSRNFSIGELHREIDRPYEMIFQ